jgi:hypothetical protein
VRITSATFTQALLATAVTLVAACTSGPEIRHETNPTASFSSYKTFGFFSPLSTDRAGYQSVFTSRLKQATRSAMEARGYVYSEDHPDLLVNFFANVQDKQDIVSTPSPVGGYYGYHRGLYGGFGTDVQTVNYKSGTLTIDLVDPGQKLLVWQATAEGRVSDEARNNPGPAIDSLVKQMLVPLPAPGGK